MIMFNNNQLPLHMDEAINRRIQALQAIYEIEQQNLQRQQLLQPQNQSRREIANHEELMMLTTQEKKDFLANIYIADGKRLTLDKYENVLYGDEEIAIDKFNHFYLEVNKLIEQGGGIYRICSKAILGSDEFIVSYLNDQLNITRLQNGIHRPLSLIFSSFEESTKVLKLFKEDEENYKREIAAKRNIEYTDIGSDPELEQYLEGQIVKYLDILKRIRYEIESSLDSFFDEIKDEERRDKCNIYKGFINQLQKSYSERDANGNFVRSSIDSIVDERFRCALDPESEGSKLPNWMNIDGSFMEIIDLYRDILFRYLKVYMRYELEPIDTVHDSYQYHDKKLYEGLSKEIGYFLASNEMEPKLEFANFLTPPKTDEDLKRDVDLLNKSNLFYKIDLMNPLEKPLVNQMFKKFRNKNKDKYKGERNPQYPEFSIYVVLTQHLFKIHYSIEKANLPELQTLMKAKNLINKKLNSVDPAIIAPLKRHARSIGWYDNNSYLFSKS